MLFKPFTYLLPAVGIAIFAGWYLMSSKKETSLRKLPHLGPARVEQGDSVFHTVPAFTFTDQEGKTITEKDVKDQIYVSEFFFTTCRSICPIMNRHLEKVYRYYRDKPFVRILSHTVDPETDSVPVLKEYALRHGVNDLRWLFLTGSEKDLYRMARKGYLLCGIQDTADSDEFVHTQNVALIDKERHIRGVYDATDSTEVNRLISDIGLLMIEP